MASGFITLDQVATHTAVLAVACSRCDRAGRYSLDTLIARHDDCPKPWKPAPRRRGNPLPNLPRRSPSRTARRRNFNPQGNV